MICAYIQSDSLDIRMHSFIDVQCAFRMKTKNENKRLPNVKYEQLELMRVVHFYESSTFLCLRIVNRPTTYVFANAYSILSTYISA